MHKSLIVFLFKFYLLKKNKTIQIQMYKNVVIGRDLKFLC